MYYRWDYRFAKWQGSGRMLVRYRSPLGELGKHIHFIHRDNNVEWSFACSHCNCVASVMGVVGDKSAPSGPIRLAFIFFYFEDDFECWYLAFN